MERTENMPIWVFFAYSAIETRKAALWLISACLLFTVYCLPWVQFAPDVAWVARIFMIEDWSYFLMMLPMCLWYVLALRWLDRHSGWTAS